MSLWHISLASEDRLPIFPQEHLRRAALHVLARVAAGVLVLFCIVDDHLHLVAKGSSERKRRLRQALLQALGPVAAAPLAPSWCGSVRDRAHLLSLVRYHLGQVVKHQVQGAHPALWSGSCFQELVGARVVPGLALRAPGLLPREQLVPLACREVGLPGFLPRPLPVPELRSQGISRIKAAAAAAVAADPRLVGKTRPAVLGRRITAHLGRIADVAPQEIAWALGVTRQRLHELLASEVPVGLLNAAGTRLALEAEVERRASRTAAAGA